jgi:ABC-type lipoprotein release transport system permease subunit
MADKLAKDEMRVGLLKALGSDEGSLLGDYLQMAALLGVSGAIPGLLAGWKITNWLNQVAPARSPELLCTPQLGAAVLFLTTLTAMVASIAPVSRAIRQCATWTLYSTSLMESASPSLDTVEASSP